MDRRNDTNRLASAGCVVTMAARTCGMPEPAAPMANWRVSHTTVAVTAGVHSSASHGEV